MKKLLKPASLLFYFLMVIVFFFIGLYLAKLVGAGKGQMLAGGATVLFYGLVSSGIAFTLALFVAHGVNHNTLIKFNKVLGVLFFLIVSITAYKVITREKKEDPVKDHPKETTAPAQQEIAMVAHKASEKQVLQQNVKESMGIGFFKPNYFEHPTLYFYGGINLEKVLIEHTPMDSVVFAKDQYNNPTTSYAPPWLYPEHLKLDYGIIIFKVLGIGRDFIKVEGNKQTKQLTYLDKNKGTFSPWAEFLLSVNSVEFNENSSKKVFVKPLDHAGEVQVTFEFMQPLLVEQDWMYVKLVDESFNEQGKGWIRWKNNNVLQIIYSLLS